MRIVLISSLAAAVLLGCGGGPVTKTEAAPEAAPEAPNPDLANPCAATTIDPTENPCAGPAAEAALREAEAATAADDAAAGEEEGEAPADGAAGPGSEGTPQGAGAATPEG